MSVKLKYFEYYLQYLGAALYYIQVVVNLTCNYMLLNMMVIRNTRRRPPQNRQKNTHYSISLFLYKQTQCTATDSFSCCGQISDQRETSDVIKWFVTLFADWIRRECPTGVFSSHKPRCSRILWMTSASVMKLMIFISLPHLGQASGSTSQTFSIHPRHSGDGIFFGR